MFSRARLTFAAALAAAVVVAGCGGSSNPGSSPGSDKAAPADQQVLRLRLNGEPRTIDPNLMTAANETSLTRQLFAGLFTYDAKLNVTPNVAAQVPTVANGGETPDALSYTIKLRNDAKWSDGQSVSAKDFVYSMQRELDPKLAAPFANFYYSIAGARDYNTALGTAAAPKNPSQADLDALKANLGVTAKDEQTVVFKLSQPDPSFLYRLAIPPSFPVRQDVIEKNGAQWTEPGKIVGNGPFILSEWSHNQRMVFVPNPVWSGSKAKLNSLVVNFIPDDAAAYAAYKAGDLDVVGVPASVVRDVTSPTSPLHSELVRTNDLASYAFYMNERVAPFDNEKVRQAFAQAIDRDALVQGVLQGAGVAQTSWIPRGQAGYDVDAGKSQTFDPKKAKETLAAAGYPDGKGLPKITFIKDATDTNKLIGQFLQDQLKKNLGVDISIDFVDSKTYSTTLNQGAWMTTFLGWSAGWPYPDNWLADLFTSDSTNNRTGFKNAGFDALIKQASSETDDAKRLAKYDEAQKLMLNSAAIAPLYVRESLILVKPKVKGLVVTPLDGGLKGDTALNAVYIGVTE